MTAIKSGRQKQTGLEHSFEPDAWQPQGDNIFVSPMTSHGKWLHRSHQSFTLAYPNQTMEESGETMLSMIRPLRKRRALAAALLATIAGATFNAHAQTPALTDAMKADISNQCMSAAEDVLQKPRIAVDPVGSQRFGLAILFGKSKASDERASVICVYDRQKKTVELGGEIGRDVLRVRGPKKGGEGNTPDDPED